MANLLNQNIGTNYKGILNLNTLNGNLSGTLQAVTDGDGNASPLRLSTTSVDINSALTASGAITSLSNITCGAGSSFVINNRIIFSSFANGSLRITNDSTVGFGLLQLGGTSNAFPAIKRNSASIDFRLADDTGFCNISAAALTLSANLVLSAGNAIYAGNQLRIGAGAISILSDSGAGINFTAGTSGRSFGVSNATSGAPSSTAFLFVGDTATGVTMGANSNNNASAVLDLVSTTQGLLFPRMTTTQVNAISTPAAGLVVYSTTENALCLYNGSSWRKLNDSPL
jgi:hypothetical protein